MARRRISEDAGKRALALWKQEQEGTLREDLYTAVRWALEELNLLYPGRAVEIRVPPAGAVQAFEGTVHRRGTPPSVIEMDPHTWLRLATGSLEWNEACATGRAQASGERTDLSNYLPFI
ncbi:MULTISPECIES: sterol carrier family protein [unclassified Schaalia]|uniref:sterol carrier family protein n=1 Tax=unclassified Schaalia TaxID=2691889 RepID=UPI001E4F7AA4|nr:MULTISPECIES: sterol carrier family protein [unclassified Schaalia]MCD4548855.1 sterol carrier family protein [Schaalia sp. lx-260]MCD4557471.1 sterol carrier family protein [Schaalia sp. lx-100]